MHVEFVGGPKNNIEDKIKNLLKHSDKISIAVAFLENSGIAIIRQNIEEIKNKVSISIITGLDFGITAPKALQELLNLDLCCNIFHGENFHPKLYIFEKNGNEATVIIGSSNLSKGGLSTNYEANIILSGDISEVPIRDSINYFSYLYSKSVPLDDNIIELYNKRKNLADEIKNEVNKDERINKIVNELKEYLSQKVSAVELTESEYEELLQAEKKFDEGGDLYEIGKMNDAYNLFKESYDIYKKLITVYGHIDNLLSGITNCLLGMGRVLYLLHNKSADVIKCTDEAEEFATLLENREHLLEAIGLGALARGITKEANERCDKFIEIYESNKSSLEYNNYNLIGNIYSRSVECKFELKTKINIAYKHIYHAINYLEKIDLSKGNFDTMIDHCSIAYAYIVKNDIQPEPDFDEKNVLDHYNKALIIARKELKSEFWEAHTMLELAAAANTKGTLYVTSSEACDYLRKSMKIFKKLEHVEIIKEIDELIKNIGCRS
ncbi:MAG: phospholipase D-like domain-containing protein [Candidatus Methanoperedens sp.]|nr:phospholipase D-like domain-containing protein [Candidatus Methanoperedens sp.]MCZ7406739.1 phospholipase D-like domain-containing protein [Candidatus Methanoperedens sp.]